MRLKQKPKAIILLVSSSALPWWKISPYLCKITTQRRAFTVNNQGIIKREGDRGSIAEGRDE
jgi:hypothetical protein